jgi:hypothetical protein
VRSGTATAFFNSSQRDAWHVSEVVIVIAIAIGIGIVAVAELDSGALLHQRSLYTSS